MKSRNILIGLIGVYIIAMIGICVFKYANNFYNGADLTIFYQAFQSLSQGDFLFVPMQGSQYFADHFSLLFFIFYPFFYLWQSPIFLLALQTLFIGLAAWPLYLISRKYLSNKKVFFVIALHLLNPFVISMNLFEFHFLPFCFFFGFWLFYFYDSFRGSQVTTRQWKLWVGFYVFLFLCLSVREDVSLFILGFSLFILYEKSKEIGFKKALKKTEFLIPFFSSIAWFAASWLIIKYFNHAPTKFLEYFNWQNVFTISQLELLLQIFLPFAFLTFFKPRFLIMGAFYYLMIAVSYGVPVVNLHYGALLLIPSFLALIFVFRDFAVKNYKNFYIKSYSKLSVLILILALLYFNIAFGPWKSFNTENKYLENENKIIHLVEDNSNIAVNAQLASKLVKNNKVFSVERIFWGTKQFSESKYEFATLDYIVIDQKELLSFQLQTDLRNNYNKNFGEGFERIQKAISDNKLHLISADLRYLVFGKNGSAKTNVNLTDLFENYNQQAVLISFYDNNILIDDVIIQPLSDQIYIDLDQAEQIKLNLVKVQGCLGLNKLMSVENLFTEMEIFEEEKILK